MPETRLVLIEGLPATGKTRLAQELGLQLEAHRMPYQSWLATSVGNPLGRPYEPDAYPDAESYADALHWQWRNFVIRAGDEPDLHVFDSALFSRHLHDALLAGMPPAAIGALANKLMTALEPLAPALFYLSRPVDDDADSETRAWQQCCERSFADIQSQRVLLNAALASPQELLQDVLHELDVTPVQLQLADEVARQLTGAYGAPDQGQAIREPQLEIVRQERTLSARILGTGAADCWRPLLPSPQGHFLVAGIDLKLYPQQIRDEVQGLLPDSQTPSLLEDWPEFLLRERTT